MCVYVCVCAHVCVIGTLISSVSNLPCFLTGKIKENELLSFIFTSNNKTSGKNLQVLR